MLKQIGRAFLKGVLVVAPVAVGLWILYWLAIGVEALLASLLPSAVYLPGTGVVATLVGVFLVGLGVESGFFRWLGEPIRGVLRRTPVAHEIYGSVRNLGAYLSEASREQDHRRVVRVDLDSGRAAVIGLVTLDDLERASKGLAEEGEIAVYVPMSWQVGGFTLIVPRSSVRTVDMSVREALGFSLSSGRIDRREEAARPEERPEPAHR